MKLRIPISISPRFALRGVDLRSPGLVEHWERALEARDDRLFGEAYAAARRRKGLMSLSCMGKLSNVRKLRP